MLRKCLIIAAGIGISAIVALAFILFGFAPYTSQSPAPFTLWPETIDAADYFGIDYGALVSAAYKGDRYAIQKLMQTTKTLSGSAAGSYGHGSALLEILWHHGEVAFIEDLSTLPTPDQKRLMFILRAGDEYTFNLSQKDKLETAFPRLMNHVETNR